MAIDIEKAREAYRSFPEVLEILDELDALRGVAADLVSRVVSAEARDAVIALLPEEMRS